MDADRRPPKKSSIQRLWLANHLDNNLSGQSGMIVPSTASQVCNVTSYYVRLFLMTISRPLTHLRDLRLTENAVDCFANFSKAATLVALVSLRILNPRRPVPVHCIPR